MKARGIPITYLEGHGFGRVANRRSFTAVVEAFLATHLGGRSSRSARILRTRPSNFPRAAS